MQPAGFIPSAVLFAIFWYVLQIRHHRGRLLPHLLHRAHLRPLPHQVSLGLAVLAEVDLWLLPAASGCIRGHASYWPGMLIMLEMHATCWLYRICCSLCYILNTCCRSATTESASSFTSSTEPTSALTPTKWVSALLYLLVLLCCCYLQLV